MRDLSTTQVLAAPQLRSVAESYWIVPVGGRFWVVLLATLAGIGIAVGLLFWLIGAALLTWGVLGTLIVVGGILLGIAWVYDRRQAREF